MYARTLAGHFGSVAWLREFTASAEVSCSCFATIFAPVDLFLVHSGCAVSATVWLVFFTAQATREVATGGKVPPTSMFVL